MPFMPTRERRDWAFPHLHQCGTSKPVQRPKMQPHNDNPENMATPMHPYSHMAWPHLHPSPNPIPRCACGYVTTASTTNPMAKLSRMGTTLQGTDSNQMGQRCQYDPPRTTDDRNTIQTTIWQHVLAIWKVRNEHLHHNADQLDLPNYCQAATMLYDQKHLLPPAAQ